MPLDHPMQPPKAAIPLTRETVTQAFRGPPDAHVEVGPHRLAYRRFGSGPDVVFVHGWPLHSATFRAVVPLLADRFTCHLFDLPGSGRTESDANERTSFESHAETLRSAVDTIGLGRFALFAHDSGGLTARLLAAGNRRVTALVLGNTDLPGYVPKVVHELLGTARLPGGAELLRFVMRFRAVRRSRAYCGCFHDLDLIDGDFHELLVAPLLADKRLWARQLDLLATVDQALVDRLPAVHARLAMPVLLLWGTEDPIFPIERARAMIDQFPRATLEPIEAGRAYVHEEHPDAFVGLAKPFLLDAFANAAFASIAS
jgi:pimeloyl-ACP methyl ester carboxylesterase